MTYKLNEELVNELDTNSVLHYDGVPYIFRPYAGDYHLVKVSGKRMTMVFRGGSIEALIKGHFTENQEKVFFGNVPLFTKESHKIVPGTKLKIGYFTYTVILDTESKELKLLNCYYKTMRDNQERFLDEDTFYEHYSKFEPQIEWPT